MATYKKSPSELRSLAEGHGSCIASKMITVEGRKVGYMYRETSDNDIDSGWRFFCGTETQEYADDASNFEIYDCNTIANYDTAIIEFLESSAGSAFERAGGDGRFVRIEPDASD